MRRKCFSFTEFLLKCLDALPFTWFSLVNIMITLLNNTNNYENKIYHNNTTNDTITMII